MLVDWDAVNQSLSPVKDYEELSRRLRESLDYPFVHETFNFTLSELAGFTRLELGGDPRGRYTAYAARLAETLAQLQQAGVGDVLDLMARAETREKLQDLVEKTGICAPDIAAVLKYMLYWFIPMEKPLIGLVPNDPALREALTTLRGLGIRTNLELLQHGLTPASRRELARLSGLPVTTIVELVNRADFSRMPWASKATISNILGAGYCSLARLAGADPEQLYADFFRYGAAIGKNLKLGNEIENSFRIAKLLPKLVEEG